MQTIRFVCFPSGHPAIKSRQSHKCFQTQMYVTFLCYWKYIIKKAIHIIWRWFVTCNNGEQIAYCKIIVLNEWMKIISGPQITDVFVRSLRYLAIWNCSRRSGSERQKRGLREPFPACKNICSSYRRQRNLSTGLSIIIDRLCKKMVQKGERQKER